MKILQRSIIATAFALATTTLPFNASAAEPANYLKSCENLNQAALLSALCNVISAHTAASYDGLYEWFLDTDVHPDGKIWDMYSTKDWGTTFSKKCGSYQVVGDCINREHSFPKSWFNDAKPMYTDVYHLYPTDGKVNGQRSNYPFGECASGTRLPSANGASPLGKLGTSTFTGYSGKVFEPDDEYKGDFARTYFYMAACYNNKIANWNSDMLAGNAYPAFTSWAVNLLLKWHRQDPVSTKEINRNNAAASHQGNRNPFIDHPELAEYIWGNKTSQKWTMMSGDDAVIVSPVDGTTINLGTTVVDGQLGQTIAIKATGLKSNLTIAVSGQGFTCSRTSIAPSAGKIDVTAVVSFSSQTVGDHIGGMILSSGDESASIVLKATVVDGLPALEATEITTESFRANWLYIGDAKPGGYYTLKVSDAAGMLDEYPALVTATDQYFDVTGLEPSTTYFYTLESASATSRTVTVNTADLQPSVQILTDIDNLVLTSTAGMPSDYAELLVDAENIFSPITISVNEPFEVSENSVDWSQQITLDPLEDRFYIRANSPSEGRFTTTILVTVDDYTNDDHTIDAIIGSLGTGINEDFERYIDTVNEGVATYNGFAYTGKTHNWQFTDAGIWASDKSSANSGTGVLRMGKTASSSITMTNDTHNGVGTVTLYASMWTASEGAAEINLDYSTDGGLTWTNAGSAKVDNTSMTPYSFVVQQPGTVRLRLAQTSGKRFLVDDISADNHTASTTTIVTEDDYYSWNAYALDGKIVVTTRNSGTVAIHDAVSGITHVDTQIRAGESTFALPKGHYIVVVGDYTRRVVVK